MFIPRIAIRNPKRFRSRHACLFLRDIVVELVLVVEVTAFPVRGGEEILKADFGTRRDDCGGAVLHDFLAGILDALLDVRMVAHLTETHGVIEVADGEAVCVAAPFGVQINLVVVVHDENPVLRRVPIHRCDAKRRLSGEVVKPQLDILLEQRGDFGAFPIEAIHRCPPSLFASLGLGLIVEYRSIEPSFLSLTLQSKGFPVRLEMQPLRGTALPASSDAACFAVNRLPHHTASLKPQPASCLKVPSSCCSLLFVQQV